MSIGEHIEEFAGYPIFEWNPEETLDDPENTLVKISVNWDEVDEGLTWVDRFVEFLELPEAAVVPGIVVGAWEEMAEGGTTESIVQMLVNAREQLKALHVIFFGDITFEECEISWIVQTDMNPLFEAFPNLTHFAVRGGGGLSLGTINHENLRELVIEAGGLGLDVVQQVLNAKLPRLERLELWLGDSNYGSNSSVDDLKPLFENTLFPRMTYLGLKNCEYTDDIAVAIASAPVLNQLDCLDLSMGTLSDRGALALLNSPFIGKLKKLDLSHHYCSNDVMAKLSKLPLEVDLSEQKEADDDGEDSYRYVAVGE